MSDKQTSEIKIKTLVIVQSTFYREIADEMLDEVKSLIDDSNIYSDFLIRYKIVRVPGSLEIPTAMHLFFENQPPDAFIALGCLVKGSTCNFSVLCNSIMSSLQNLAISYAIPFGCGIMMLNSISQAKSRSKKYAKNAFRGCLNLMHLVEDILDEE